MVDLYPVNVREMVHQLEEPFIKRAQLRLKIQIILGFVVLLVGVCGAILFIGGIINITTFNIIMLCIAIILLLLHMG